MHVATHGRVEHFDHLCRRMPAHAQRELSASVVALHVHEFDVTLKADDHWESARRYVNWMAHQGPVSGGWTRVVPWDRQGNLNLTNTAYLINFCRRYRLERPTRLQGPDPCKCGWCKGHIAHSVFDGDHDEADCPKRAWARTMTRGIRPYAPCHARHT